MFSVDPDSTRPPPLAREEPSPLLPEWDHRSGVVVVVPQYAVEAVGHEGEAIPRLAVPLPGPSARRLAWGPVAVFEVAPPELRLVRDGPAEDGHERSARPIRVLAAHPGGLPRVPDRIALRGWQSAGFPEASGLFDERDDPPEPLRGVTGRGGGEPLPPR